jgi:hypothetical protein
MKARKVWFGPLLNAVVVTTALTATDASAQVQGADLNGTYRCVAFCGGAGRSAVITQNGWDFNVVINSGQASRGWVDWPGHIWIDRLQQGAIYSPDGSRIQFDNGTVWRRI